MKKMCFTLYFHLNLSCLISISKDEKYNLTANRKHQKLGKTFTPVRGYIQVNQRLPNIGEGHCLLSFVIVF